MSLQSHSEVLHALDCGPSIPLESLQAHHEDDIATQLGTTHNQTRGGGKIFVASVSPQVRASLAATYGTTEQEAGWMLEQLLSGPNGLESGGQYGNKFTWVVDTNAMREACLVMGAEEVMNESLNQNPTADAAEDGTVSSQPRKPILTSACPGWICYAEKTHPHVLPHLSRLKSPQALTGTLLKTMLSTKLNIRADQIWHLAIMPCFDKKLEASRSELTDAHWSSESASSTALPIRDVDCVITAREVLMLAETRGISFPLLPREPFDIKTRIPFPDTQIDDFLFPDRQSLDHRIPKSSHRRRQLQTPETGSSGGYLWHILRTQQNLHPSSSIVSTRGRNADVVDYTLICDSEVLFRAARYYGFRNIQNLVRKLKPVKKSRLPGGKAIGARKPAGKAEVDYAYVEVMACPGGCTNGGGQIKVEDVGILQGVERGEGQREWLGRVDEAYFSMEEESEEEKGDSRGDEDGSVNEDSDGGIVNGIDTNRVKALLDHWASSTGLELDRLLYTTYRTVESDVGKDKGRDMERVVELAGKIGGGW